MLIPDATLEAKLAALPENTKERIKALAEIAQRQVRDIDAGKNRIIVAILDELIRVIGAPDVSGGGNLQSAESTATPAEVCKTKEQPDEKK